MEIIEFILKKNLGKFSGGIRVIIKGIRKKDDQLNGSKRDKFKEKIYSIVNSRDVKKAIMHFKKEIIEKDYMDNEETLKFYFNIQNRFCYFFVLENTEKQNIF